MFVLNFLVSPEAVKYFFVNVVYLLFNSSIINCLRSPAVLVDISSVNTKRARSRCCQDVRQADKKATKVV